MGFLTEPEPPRGVAQNLLPGIRRIVARNPSVMTYRGTNTYLIDDDAGLTVLDPGPDDPQHVADIMAASGTGGIQRILLTHTHDDHYGALPALRQATGAPVYSYVHSAKAGFTPDHELADDDAVAGLRAVFTPGHAPDHLCFAYQVPAAGAVLFSGDHVMSWSSSIVSPPNGDMRDYYHALQRLLARQDALYLPGHGPILPEPQTLVAELLAHRRRREATILARLRQQPWSVASLAGSLYDKTDPWLKIAAQHNVLAHLLKLQAEGVLDELPPDETQPPDPALAAFIATTKPRPGGAEAMERTRRSGLRRFAIRPGG